MPALPGFDFQEESLWFGRCLYLELILNGSLWKISFHVLPPNQTSHQ